MVVQMKDGLSKTLENTMITSSISQMMKGRRTNIIGELFIAKRS